MGATMALVCGIVGGWWPGSRDERSTHLQAGIDSLAHRGPDDRGAVTMSIGGGSLALGHTRLSVIDLSAAGHQPMLAADGRYSISYNGEIYNYRELRTELRALGHDFASDSDTEVLLTAWRAWGVACLPRLCGMFAFAVVDTERERLTCVRDAFGIKPLYYHASRDGLVFASEISALLKLMRETPRLDHQRAYEYLVYGRYDTGRSSFFEGIHHLQPGHTLSVELAGGGRSEESRWWSPGTDESGDGVAFAEASTGLRERFLRSVRLHLRSDVPLGAAVSGGIDSSAVACAMRWVEPDIPISTFSFVARGTTVDEEPWVDLVNEHIGAVAHKIVISPGELARDLDDMIRAQGEPFGSTSIYAQYRVYRAAKDHGITVTLDGQGADELLAGYHGYPAARMESLVRRGRLTDLLRFMEAWARFPGRSRTQAALNLASLFVPEAWRARAYRALGRSPEPAWLDADRLREAGVHVGPPAPVPSGRDSGRSLAIALRHAMSGDGLAALLRHGDRNAMRWSIESRVPFLTTELAEFALGLPERYLVSEGGQTKHLFRHAMRGIVPDAILDRRDKIGFQTPEVAWLRLLGDDLLEWVESAEELPFLRAARCRDEVRRLVDGRTSLSGPVWRLLNYCRWWQLRGAGGATA
jgi:asparagine synthase (glutamine-hydrolysing)